MKRASLLALALGAAACHRGGEAVLWVGVPDEARVATFDAAGSRLGLEVGPPVLDTPARALVLRRDGAVIALQEPEACQGGALDYGSDACVPATAARVAVPPAVVLSRRGVRVLAFAAADGGGTPLFTAAAPPWAAAEDAAGRVWVTGRAAPVVYAPGGALAFQATALPFPTRGVAALSDGRVVVSYGVQDLAVYGADGTLAFQIPAPLPAGYDLVDALAVAADGTLLLGAARTGVTSVGVVLRARIEGTALVMAQDPAASAALPGGVPSALVAAAGRIATGPPLGRVAPEACGRWLSADLGAEQGCVVPAAHRGVAWLE